MEQQKQNPVRQLKGGFMMLPAKAGTCPDCATEHAPELPHNKQSLYYQMWFENEHGVGASWIDAMAHCTPEMQEQWKHHLTKLKQDLGTPWEQRAKEKQERLALEAKQKRARATMSAKAKTTKSKSGRTTLKRSGKAAKSTK